MSSGNVINYTIRVNDTAGNWRNNDTIITVALNIVPPAPPSGGGSTSGAEAGADVKAQETAIMTEELCEQSEGMLWFQETCYNCDGKLLEVPTGEVKCIKCKEGFKMSKRGSCLIDSTTYDFKSMITIGAILIIGFSIMVFTENREWINRKIFKR